MNSHVVRCCLVIRRVGRHQFRRRQFGGRHARRHTLGRRHGVRHHVREQWRATVVPGARIIAGAGTPRSDNQARHAHVTRTRRKDDRRVVAWPVAISPTLCHGAGCVPTTTRGARGNRENQASGCQEALANSEGAHYLFHYEERSRRRAPWLSIEPPVNATTVAWTLSLARKRSIFRLVP